MKTIEIEIQVKVEHIQSLVDFLDMNASFKGQTHQIDEYYSPAQRDFLAPRPVQEWLRLRDADEQHSVTYKRWHYDSDGRSHYCDEYETPVAHIETMRKIFTALDMRKLGVVDKTRRTWHFEDYEISVDSVKSLGNFVEVEHLTGDTKESPREVTDRMVQFLRDRNCGTIERNYQGYPFLILFPDEVKWERV